MAEPAEIRLLVTIRVEAGDDVRVSIDTAPGVNQTPTPRVDAFEDVLEGVASRVRPHVEDFAHRGRSLGLVVERPQGDRQDYRNVFAPTARVRSRVATINVVTGRLAIAKLPELANEEPLADVVTNNGEPYGVKIYLTSQERVDAALRLCDRALALRGDVMARDFPVHRGAAG